MEKLMAIWSYLDGKKTAIGGVLGFAYMITVMQGWLPYDQTAVNLFELIFGIGLIHKFDKYLGLASALLTALAKLAKTVRK